MQSQSQTIPRRNKTTSTNIVDSLTSKLTAVLEDFLFDIRNRHCILFFLNSFNCYFVRAKEAHLIASGQTMEILSLN